MTFRVGLCLGIAALATLYAQGSSVDISGVWIDSQANRYSIARVKESPNYTFECPDCRFGAGAESRSQALKVRVHTRNGTTFEPTQRSQAFVRGNLGSSGIMRLILNLSGIDSPFEIALVRETLHSVSTDSPERVALQLTQSSTAIGKWIPMYVSLVDAQGRAAKPARETLVRLKVDGGAPVPAVIRLTPEVPRVPAGVVVSAGYPKLEASTEGLNKATVFPVGCEEKPSHELRLVMNTPRTRALADGRDAIPVLLSLVDETNTLASDLRTKYIGLDVDGVARLLNHKAMASVVIPAGQCLEERWVVADTAGESVVSVAFGGNSQEKHLSFEPLLTFLAIALAIVGGLLGGFVAAARAYNVASRWKTRRWTYWLISACAGGLVVYLAYFYGLLRLSPVLPSGAGFAFLVGLLGGFLGAEALERLSSNWVAAAAPVSRS